MRRYTLPLAALLAVAIVAMVAMSGCGSSSTSNTPVNKAEIVLANSVSIDWGFPGKLKLDKMRY